MFPNFDSFCQVMDQCTENYECLVIDNTSASNKIEDLVFWYKADLLGDFTVGASEFWEHHSNNFGDSEYTESDKFSANSYRKKNAPQINVQKRSY